MDLSADHPGILSLLNSLSDRLPDEGGAYRKVYFISLEGKRYALKVDRTPFHQGSHLEGLCNHEYQTWLSLRGTSLSEIMVPVVSHGKLECGRGWNLMPFLHPATYLRSMYSYRESLGIIYNSIRERFPATVKGFCIQIAGLGCDLHLSNWGQDLDGQWKCFDYGYSGES